MGTGRQLWRWGAALAIVTVGALSSAAAVPIYDGVGNPDQPYRYVGRANAPVAASASATVSSGTSGSLTVRSSENGPQVLVDLGAGAFRSTTPAVTLTATPVVGDGQTTADGTIDGNVYRITATPGAVLQVDTAQGFLFLRAAVMTRPDPVVVHRTSPTDAWQAVSTTRAGQDILSTPFRALGDYAVVRTPGSKPLATDGLGLTRTLLLGGGVLALVVITIVVLRRPQPED